MEAQKPASVEVIDRARQALQGAFSAGLSASVKPGYDALQAHQL